MNRNLMRQKKDRKLFMNEEQLLPSFKSTKTIFLGALVHKNMKTNISQEPIRNKAVNIEKIIYFYQ